MSTSEEVVLKDVLAGKKQYRGWLYLPAQPWTLNSKGYFVSFDKDEDPQEEGKLPPEIQNFDLEETIDAATVENVISNSRQQVGPNISLEQLLEAFKYYVERDAFIRFAK